MTDNYQQFPVAVDPHRFGEDELKIMEMDPPLKEVIIFKEKHDQMLFILWVGIIAILLIGVVIFVTR